MENSLRDLLPAIERDDRARRFLKHVYACALASRHHQFTPEQLVAEYDRKAAVPAATTTNTPALSSADGRAFVRLLDSGTVRGKLAGTLQAPPNVVVPFPSNDPRPQWVAEGNPIPVAEISFDAPATARAKYALIVGFTEELERVGDPRALDLIERVLMRAARRADDELFLGDDAAVTGSNPAGLLHGLTPIGAGSPAAFADQLHDLWTAVSDGAPAFPHFVVSPRGALYLASLHVDGTPVFPAVGPLGGTIYTVPVIVSRAAGNKLVLLDAGAIAMVDDGVEIVPARSAAVEMSDTPSGGGVQMVSAFQSNTLFVKLTRYASWTKLADDAVQYLELPISGSPS